MNKEIFITSNFIVEFSPSSKYEGIYKSIIEQLNSYTTISSIINDIYTYLVTLNFSKLLNLQVMSVSFGNLQLSVDDNNSVNTLNLSSNEITVQFLENFNLPIYKTFYLMREKIRTKKIIYKNDYSFDKISVSIFKTVESSITDSLTSESETFTFINCIPKNISLNTNPKIDESSIFTTSVTFTFDYFTNS